MSHNVMEFVGVSTARSSVRDLFPLWARELDLDARLTGRDLPLNADPARYREAVQRIIAEPAVRGALVTSHKVGLFAAGHDLFHELDDYARRCGEVSCIAKRAGYVTGYAKDPITVERALWPVLGERHFASTGGHAICLGAGGAGMAFAVHMLRRPAREDRPERLVLSDTDSRRLSALRTVCESFGDHGVDVGYVHVAGSTDNDALVAGAPPGSLVVNATGMGKDLPGSPLSQTAGFPKGAIVWDLNYRGELDFLRQARERAGDDELRIEDGWLYFLHGWAEHIAEVFGLALSPGQFDRLHAIANEWRSGARTRS